MMEEWLQIRERVLREGVSKRQILRETGMHWTTLERILSHPIPPGYCRKQPISSKIDPYLGQIRKILEQDRCTPKKQRHTAKRIWELLQADGFDGGYTIVKDAVRQIKKAGQATGDTSAGDDRSASTGPMDETTDAAGPSGPGRTGLCAVYKNRSRTAVRGDQSGV